MAGVKVFGITIFRGTPEKEIEKSFDRYGKLLNDQKSKLLNTITQWEEGLIDSIHKHVNQQKHLLEQHYLKKIEELNGRYGQFIEQVHLYEQNNNTEEVVQLLDRCKALKFELAALQYSEETIQFIKVPSGEQSVLMNRDEFGAVATKNDQFDNNSTRKYKNETEYNRSTDSTLYPNIPSRRARRTDTQPPRTNSEDVYNRSTVYRDDVLSECSTCCMTFPSNMAPGDRLAHVNGHFTNN